jgi:hypothetical protein
LLICELVSLHTCRPPGCYAELSAEKGVFRQNLVLCHLPKLG